MCLVALLIRKKRGQCRCAKKLMHSNNAQANLMNPPSALEVVASGDAVDVHNLARKEQSWYGPAFHGAHINRRQCNASTRYKLLLEGALPNHLAKVKKRKKIVYVRTRALSGTELPHRKTSLRQVLTQQTSDESSKTC